MLAAQLPSLIERIDAATAALKVAAEAAGPVSPPVAAPPPARPLPASRPRPAGPSDHSRPEAHRPGLAAMVGR